MSRANAERAGVAGITEFQERAIEDLAAPVGPPGLVIVNPPYGDRVGEKGRVKLALSRARADAADAVRRLARGSDHE